MTLNTAYVGSSLGFGKQPTFSLKCSMLTAQQVYEYYLKIIHTMFLGRVRFISSPALISVLQVEGFLRGKDSCRLQPCVRRWNFWCVSSAVIIAVPLGEDKIEKPEPGQTDTCYQLISGNFRAAKKQDGLFIGPDSLELWAQGRVFIHPSMRGFQQAFHFAIPTSFTLVVSYAAMLAPLRFYIKLCYALIV